MSSEILKRAEDIFDLMQEKKVSSEEGKALLHRLHRFVNPKDELPPMTTPNKTSHIGHGSHPDSSSKSNLCEEDDEVYSDCNDLYSDEKRTGRVSPAQFADLRKEIDLYRSSRKESLQAELDIHKEMADIRRVLAQQAELLKDLLQRVPQALQPASASSRKAVDVLSVGLQTDTLTNERTDQGDHTELARENPHPLDAKIALKGDSGDFTVEVEMESVPSVIRSYCKQFNADEAIANMRSSSSWGPKNKYYALRDDEIKAQW